MNIAARARPSALNTFAQLGGANTEMLAGCPSHEHGKFVLLGLLHLVVAVTYAYLAYWITAVSLRDAPWLRAAPILVAATTFLIIVSLLASAIHKLTGWKHASSSTTTTTPHSPFFKRVIARFLKVAGLMLYWMLLASILFAMLDWLFANADIPILQGQLESAWAPLTWRVPLALLSFCFALPAAPLILCYAWASPAYDALLIAIRSTPPAQAAAPNHLDSAPSTISTEEQLRLELRLTAAFEENPRSVEIGKKLIEIRRKIGKPAEALPVYDALLADAPDNEKLLREKAELYRELGDVLHYRKLLDRAEHILENSLFRQNVGRAYHICSISTAGLDFFGDATWTLQPRMNILLGRNGYGKTLLLRALVGVVQCNEKITAEMFTRKSEQKIAVKMQREGKLVETVRSAFAFNGNVGKMPVLAIPDVRYVNKSEASFAPPSGVADLRSDSARHFLLEQPYEGMIATILYELCLDFVASGNWRSPLFDLIEQSVQRLIQSKFRIHSVIRRDSARFEITVITEANGDTPLPLQRASQGTLSVIAMIGLTYKYLHALHPNLPDTEICKGHGVVVIDEIDAHLHPSWQREILTLFRESFPNVQFIVTAHSPLVVAGAKIGEVAVLRKNKQNQFAVQVREEHFIGATSEELYRRIFEIEATDVTYQQLELLHLRKDAMRKRERELDSRSELTPALQEELIKLKNDLYYLRRFEEVKKKRDNTQNLQERNQELDIEAARLRTQTEQLNKQVERLKETDPGAHMEHTETFFRRISGDTRTESALEEFAASLADIGRNKEAAAAWQALLESHPGNSKYARRLIAENLKLQDYEQALSLARSALGETPNDPELRSMVERLEQCDRLAGSAS